MFQFLFDTFKKFKSSTDLTVNAFSKIISILQKNSMLTRSELLEIFELIKNSTGPERAGTNSRCIDIGLYKKLILDSIIFRNIIKSKESEFIKLDHSLCGANAWINEECLVKKEDIPFYFSERFFNTLRNIDVEKQKDDTATNGMSNNILDYLAIDKDKKEIKRHNGVRDDDTDGGSNITNYLNSLEFNSIFNVDIPRESYSHLPWIIDYKQCSVGNCKGDCLKCLAVDMRRQVAMQVVFEEQYRRKDEEKRREPTSRNRYLSTRKALNTKIGKPTEMGYNQFKDATTEEQEEYLWWKESNSKNKLNDMEQTPVVEDIRNQSLSYSSEEKKLINPFANTSDIPINTKGLYPLSNPFIGTPLNITPSFLSNKSNDDTSQDKNTTFTTPSLFNPTDINVPSKITNEDTINEGIIKEKSEVINQLDKNSNIFDQDTSNVNILEKDVGLTGHDDTNNNGSILKSDINVFQTNPEEKTLESVLDSNDQASKFADSNNDTLYPIPPIQPTNPFVAHKQAVFDYKSQNQGEEMPKFSNNNGTSNTFIQERPNENTISNPFHHEKDPIMSISNPFQQNTDGNPFLHVQNSLKNDLSYDQNHAPAVGKRKHDYSKGPGGIPNTSEVKTTDNPFNNSGTHGSSPVITNPFSNSYSNPFSQNIISQGSSMNSHLLGNTPVNNDPFNSSLEFSNPFSNITADKAIPISTNPFNNNLFNVDKIESDEDEGFVRRRARGRRH